VFGNELEKQEISYFKLTPDIVVQPNKKQRFAITAEASFHTYSGLGVGGAVDVKRLRIGYKNYPFSQYHETTIGWTLLRR